MSIIFNLVFVWTNNLIKYSINKTCLFFGNGANFAGLLNILRERKREIAGKQIGNLF